MLHTTVDFLHGLFGPLDRLAEFNGLVFSLLVVEKLGFAVGEVTCHQLVADLVATCKLIVELPQQCLRNIFGFVCPRRY